jgi:hypothetical protein
MLPVGGIPHRTQAGQASDRDAAFQDLDLTPAAHLSQVVREVGLQLGNRSRVHVTRVVMKG